MTAKKTDTSVTPSVIEPLGDAGDTWAKMQAWMRKGLTIWVIYERPIDYPDHFVVRPHHVLPTGTDVGDAMLFESLEAARAAIPQGLVCEQADPMDARCIVESWM